MSAQTSPEPYSRAMEITIFPSDKGDCLLLTGDDGKRILADGGMRSSFVRHVAPELGALRSQNPKATLDVVYVSHIDQDHIAGVLKLLDDLVAWRIFDHQRANGDPTFPEPDAPRPPEVGEIWHNGFREQVEDNDGEIERLLAATATVLSGHPSKRWRSEAEYQRNLATSEREAVLLQRRISQPQLGIPLNQPANGQLMMVRESGDALAVGGMRVFILAPFKKDLEKLRDRWNKWLEKNHRVLEEVRRASRETEDLLGTSEIERFISLMTAEAKALGNRKQITAPNLASLMLLVEEGERTLLLTGDGFADDVLAGLRHHGMLDGPGLHVDVLKIPHHGATANITDEFATTITADHYIFCGNGEHENPELAVVERIIDSRIGRSGKKSSNPTVNDPFALWFSCSPDFPRLPADNVRHMSEVQQLVKRRAGRSGGRLRYHFLSQQPLSLSI